MESDFSGFLQSWSLEIASRANRVRHLIGDAHWLSDGHHREEVLREFLRRHLPSNLIVSRGFVKTPEPSAPCSPEIDILVCDPAKDTPYFNEADLLITPSAAVLAHIEAKPEFNKSNLAAALATQIATQEVISQYSAITATWRGIFFATLPDSRDLTSILKTLQDTVSDHTILTNNLPKATIGLPSNLTAPHLPTSIFFLNGPLILLGASASLTSVRVRMFEVGQLGMACAFADLFAHIRSWINPQESTAGLQDTIANTIDQSPKIADISLLEVT
jgi:hypothetical protein